MRAAARHSFPRVAATVPNGTRGSGYRLLKAELSYAHVFARTASSPREITVRLVGGNLLNETIRNHVSLKKDEALQPEPGAWLCEILTIAQSGIVPFSVESRIPMATRSAACTKTAPSPGGTATDAAHAAEFFPERCWNELQNTGDLTLSAMSAANMI